MASINEKVSDLLELYATDIQSNDILLATDMSVRESKKIEIGQLLLFIESSGSFLAYDSTHAGTASYILASGVNGVVAGAQTHLNQYPQVGQILLGQVPTQLTASLAVLALASLNTNAIIASFLQYTATPNGTASYAILAANANTATTAYNLFYNGQPNGTASSAVGASNVISTSCSISSSNAITSSFSPLSISSSFTFNSTSASVAIQSNQSQTSSYLVNNGPKFIIPVTIASTVNLVPFTTFDCSPYVPKGTQTVILDGWAINNNTNNAAFIYIRSSGVGQTYILTSYKSAGGGDAVSMGGQGCFPTSASTLQYSFSDAASGGTTLRLIGYY